MILPSITHEVSELEANLCSAFADPTRILILYALNNQPCNVTDLARGLGLAQPSVSRHLKVLRDHNLVRTTRAGVSIVYELADYRLIEALNIVHAVLRDQISHKASVVSEFKE
jgi:DNA-binding transcriptional ArsR family regulator